MRTRRGTKIGAAAVALGVASTLAACGSSAKPKGQTPTGKGPGGSINVLAASSLTGSFTKLAKDFEAAHPGTDVNLSFAATSTLVTQIQNGAPADVFASADTKNMQKLADAGSLSRAPVVFAKNQLEIAVAPGNAKGVASVKDLAKPGLIVVLCAAQVPCGKYADQLLSQDHVTFTPKSRELDVKSTLSKVELGEADAAVVYVTDVKAAAGKVDGVPIPDDQNVVATIPIAALKDAKNAALAQAWVEYVTSSATEQTLQQRFGFLAP